MRILSCWLLLSINFLMSTSATAADQLSVEPNRMRAHIEFLASDQLRGRKPGTPGYRIAAEYVAAQFMQLGLEPGGNEDTYYQAVPLREYALVKNSSMIELQNAGRNHSLEFDTDYVMWGSSTRDEDALEAPLVFVGYGVVSPQFDHDDYAGLDVKGKIVVTFAGKPKAWPTEEGAHLGSGREKKRHAAERGAVGMINVHTPRRDKVLPWDQMQKYARTPSMAWLDTNGIPDGVMKPVQISATMRGDSVERLFEGSAFNVEKMYAADLDGGAILTGELPASVKISRKSTWHDFTSPNVAGIVRGAAPELSGEYLLYTAHLDHLGVLTSKTGEEEIHNGAMDNAAGVATMLEMARVLQAERRGLKRSVMFLAVTGEEQGLLGAGYFAGNPTVPIRSLVANINLDMPVLTYSFADVIAFGAQHSDLQTFVEKAASQADIQLSPDPWPDEGLFTRSDHYKLVQQGVPAVYLATGIISRDPNQNAAEAWAHFRKNHYHRGSDNAELPIDYDAAAKFGEINVNIGREICNAPRAPRWNEGDFFGDLFGT